MARRVGDGGDLPKSKKSCIRVCQKVRFGQNCKRKCNLAFDHPINRFSQEDSTITGNQEHDCLACDHDEEIRTNLWVKDREELPGVRVAEGPLSDGAFEPSGASGILRGRVTLTVDPGVNINLRRGDSPWRIEALGVSVEDTDRAGRLDGVRRAGEAHARASSSRS